MKLEVTAANSVPTARRLIPILASLVIVLDRRQRQRKRRCRAVLWTR